MITIYHLGVSQSDRIVWLMEELKLPYKLEWFDREEDGQAPEEYRALHPVGTSPIIKDGDLLLSESVAIVEYISHKYGDGRLSVGPDQPNYPEYIYWMQFNSNVQSVLIGKAVLGDSPDADNVVAKMIKHRESAYYHYLDDHLSQSKYVAGDEFSCADIMAVFNLTTLPLFGGRTIDDLPNVQRYIDEITKRPAYIKAMSTVGPQAQKPD